MGGSFFACQPAFPHRPASHFHANYNTFHALSDSNDMKLPVIYEKAIQMLTLPVTFLLTDNSQLYRHRRCIHDVISEFAYDAGIQSFLNLHITKTQKIRINFEANTTPNVFFPSKHAL